MVPIATNRDDRKLLAVAGAVVVAAALAFMQLQFARAGRPSPLSVTVTTVSTYFQFAVTAVSDVTRGAFSAVVRTPALAHDNAALQADNQRLRAENDTLNERVARIPAELALSDLKAAHPDGISATVIGYDPEAATRELTIDVGMKDGIHRDDGVLSGEGVVGRVVEVDPLSSKVLLVTDAASKLPAVVQHGRWWAIAVGTTTRVKLQYISQDAKLKVGDRVVTGEGRSFHAGVLIGRIRSLEPSAAGALDQTAIVQPAADLAALSRVLVVSHDLPQR